MKLDSLNNKNRMITLQLIGWGVILGISLFWSRGADSEGFSSFGLTLFTIDIITLIVIYLLNYLLFIPNYLFRDNKARFFIANILLIAVLLLFDYYIETRGVLEALRPTGMPPRPRTGLMFLLRNLINYVLMIGLVTAFRLAERLQQSEEALKEAESARVKAELANLRSQINPHFLLNTLNNIYSLTAIDVDKAQSAIKELSRLLQYVLYDNRSDRVLLTSEVEFLKNYIELMRLRLGSNTQLDIEFKIEPKSETQIAPLLIISLIENAFKHGIKAGERCFIELEFEDREQDDEIYLLIRNSNHATSQSDKSGHGVGLEQVRSRLKLLYAGMYEWNIEQSDEIYSSELIIKTK